jgi:hypothetical protein
MKTMQWQSQWSLASMEKHAWRFIFHQYWFILKLLKCYQVRDSCWKFICGIAHNTDPLWLTVCCVYPSNSLFSQRQEPPCTGWVSAIQIPKFKQINILTLLCILRTWKFSFSKRTMQPTVWGLKTQSHTLIITIFTTYIWYNGNLNKAKLGFPLI